MFQLLRAPHSTPSSNFCLYLFHKSHEAVHCIRQYNLNSETTALSSTCMFKMKQLQLFHKSQNIFQLPHLKDLNQS